MVRRRVTRYRLRRRRTRTTGGYPIYPLLVWVPFFVADASVPPFPDVPGGPELPGGSGSTSASIDGAALVGFSLEKARWRLDAEGIWGAWTTERETPLLKVDLDVIYGHVSDWRQGLQGPVRDGRRSTTRPHVRHHSGRTVAVQTKARPLGPTCRSRLACRAWTQVGTASDWRGRRVWRRSRSGSVGGGPR